MLRLSRRCFNAPISRLSLLGAARAFIVVVALGTVVAMALMWPTNVGEKFSEVVQPSDKATVTGIDDRPCGATVSDRCVRVLIHVDSGSDDGSRGVIQWNANGVDPPVHVGDKLRVARAEEVPGYEQVGQNTYQLVDFQRGPALILLFVIFAVLVLLLSRLRGALSLLGLGVSLVLILVYIIPAILDGEPPVAVAISGSLAIGLITILLAHGRGPKSIAAMLGTSASLLLTALLAVIFTSATRLTGLAGEEAFALRLADPSVSLQGLLIAGMIIGALGVLDDVTVSQSSTVFALRAANPELGFRELFRRAMDVGRDHVAATVNTLVLAYAGSSLPVLLIFASGALGAGDALNLELVSEQVVATLVGSIGLIAAVPSTTALAALLALHTPHAEVEREAAHGHAHVH
ncbi:YibE/F family protein [Conexibacter woesei]|uniref:YibE/F family protein n=1 Tax=Conexibacter woesei (strain DSM 14684 / CCUG 47730 / CIP 108061 / JCM 11494 / NBRC 100937 / ID131577) TaxID=469383 RepID=D3F1X4_CONWI|nr:YibE/F family protein [Conexibacter woesei]ADB54155.1 YibE/F family protein [Conexibacter woesei DSM 14684]